MTTPRKLKITALMSFSLDNITIVLPHFHSLMELTETAVKSQNAPWTVQLLSPVHLIQTSLVH